MKLKTITCLVSILAIILIACSKDTNHESTANESKEHWAADMNRATQISGVGYFDGTDNCNSASQGADFALIMTGDLEGCLYVFVEESECSPSGTYREVGRELFVGTYNGQYGEFETTYKFEARYEGCSSNGTPLGAEIFGRCQHPIVEGSGTGVFEGVSGRIDFKDDIEAGNFPYRGHFSFK